MCGRYANYSSADDVVRVFGVDLVSAVLAPSWNIAPTHDVAIIVQSPVGSDPPGNSSVRELCVARWGLIPPWIATPGTGPPLINARAETLTSKPSFRSAASRRRAIVLASGYYEWVTNPDGSKTPLFLHPPYGGLVGFAGVFEWGRPSTLPGRAAHDRPPCSVAIVTRAASDILGHIHDRMPVVVPPDFADPWLDPALTGREEVDALLRALPDPELIPREVSPAVGSVRNNTADLVAPIPGFDRHQELPG